MFKSVISIIAMAFISTSAMAYENEINKMSLSITEQVDKLGKKRIAVVDFTDLQGNVTELGRFLAEEIAVATMNKSPSFSTIDRTHLKAIMKEHKLSETGIIDPDTARKIGKIAGVDGLITGTLTPFGDSIRITLKVEEAKTQISASFQNVAGQEFVRLVISPNGYESKKVAVMVGYDEKFESSAGNYLISILNIDYQRRKIFFSLNEE